MSGRDRWGGPYIERAHHALHLPVHRHGAVKFCLQERRLSQPVSSPAGQTLSIPPDVGPTIHRQRSDKICSPSRKDPFQGGSPNAVQGSERTPEPSALSRHRPLVMPPCARLLRSMMRTRWLTSSAFAFEPIGMVMASGLRPADGVRGDRRIEISSTKNRKAIDPALIFKHFI